MRKRKRTKNYLGYKFTRKEWRIIWVKIAQYIDITEYPIFPFPL